MLSRMFPRHKAHPDQAGFFRRGLAFIFDISVVGVISFLIWVAFTEIRGKFSEEPGMITQVFQALEEGAGFSIRAREDAAEEKSIKNHFLKKLKGRVSDEEYERAKEMSSEEMYHAFEEEFIAAGTKHKFIYIDESFNIIKEYIISLLYFVLFFRFKARTPGKKIFRLKVVDLEGRPRLGWYQCFERAHGYVCSTLFASLGFWQVLWNKKGLAMHDKLAGTTVVKLPKKKRPKSNKEAKTKTVKNPVKTTS